MDVLSGEVERLKEGILAQLKVLRWQVVDFSITEALAAAGGVVELRLHVSSDVWRAKNEADREQRAKEEEERIESEKRRAAAERQKKAEEEEREQQRKREEEEAAIREEERLRHAWMLVKEKVRQRVFDEARREQNQRMIFAHKLRDSFGMQKRRTPLHTEGYALPFDLPSYADDPFPVDTLAPPSPRRAEPPSGSLQIAAEDSIGAASTGSTANDPGHHGHQHHQQQQQSEAPSNVRAIALQTRKPARKWQAGLHPGLVFVIDARLDVNGGLSGAEEWWVGHRFGDESGQRRAVPARSLHVIHGDPQTLPQWSLGDLLQREGMEEEKEEEKPIAAVSRQEQEQPEPSVTTVPPPPAAEAVEAGVAEQKRKQAEEALEREREKEKAAEVEREKAREAEREREREREEARKVKEAEELRKQQQLLQQQQLQQQQLEEKQRREEEAERKRIESEQKAAQERAALATVPEQKDNNADKSRSSGAPASVAAYNMMPVPVISSEIAAAIKERRRKSATVSTDASVADKPDHLQRERRSTTAAIIQQASITAGPAAGDAAASSPSLRPLPPSRLSRRSLDPSAAVGESHSDADGDSSAPPPLPPLPAVLPSALPPVLSTPPKITSLPSSSIPAVGTPPVAAAAHPPNAAGVAPGPSAAALAAIAREKRLSLPPHMLMRALAAAGPPPALPPMPTTNIPSQPQQTVSSSSLPTVNKRKSLESAGGALSSSTSELPTAGSFQVKREELAERKRSATVVSGGSPAVPQRSTSSSALRAQTLRPSRKDKEEKKKKEEEKEKDKVEKKKKKEEEREKKRKEKEKKKEEKKKKKGA